MINRMHQKETERYAHLNVWMCSLQKEGFISNNWIDVSPTSGLSIRLGVAV